MNKLFDNPALKAIRALDDSPAMRVIRALEDSPSLKLMHELDESPSIRALKQLENSPAMQTIRQFEYSPAFKGLQQLQESPALRAIRALETTPLMEAFSRIAHQLNHGHGVLTFAEAYELLSEEYDQYSSVESLDLLSGEVQERARLAPAGVLSAEFYLASVLTLFLFYLSQMSAQDSEERLLERMANLELTINAQLNNLHEKGKEPIFLVADRTMNLRAGPGVDYEVISGLFANQKLIEMERDRDWVKIEYFDHINNVNVVGWAHSRYLLVISTIDRK